MEALTPTRGQILRLLWQEPGLSTRGVAIAVDMEVSTAEYHLHRLERAGAIVTLKAGRSRAHFPNGWGSDEGRRRHVLTEDARLVLDELRAFGPLMRPIDIARRAGLSRERVRNALHLAISLGLARRVACRCGKYEVVA